MKVFISSFGFKRMREIDSTANYTNMLLLRASERPSFNSQTDTSQVCKSREKRTGRQIVKNRNACSSDDNGNFT